MSHKLIHELMMKLRTLLHGVTYIFYYYYFFYFNGNKRKL